MAEKRLNVRYASTGGREIKREMEGIGETGERAFVGIRQRAAEMAASVRDSLNKASRAVGVLGAAVSVASGAITLAVRGQVQAADEIGRLSRISNTGAEDFQRFAFAAQSVGIEQDKLADILKDVNDRVGDFLTTGGGPMKDFFEQVAPQVGVTAEQFRNLSGKDALQLFVTSLEQANLGQEEMTFFLEAMASDATALIPLLRGNGEELERLGAVANVFSDDTISGARKFNENMAQLGQVFQSILGDVTEALLPSLVGLSETIAAMAERFRELPPEAVEWFAKLAGILVVGGPLLLGLSALLAGVAALISPFGLVVVAVAGVVAALVAFWPELVATKDRITEFVADASDAFWRMKESVAMAIDQAVAWVREQFTALVEWFRELPEQMVQIGRDIIQGLADGLLERWEAVKGRVTGVFTGFTDSVRDAFSIRSPSRVFADIGKQLMEGLLMGMTQEGFKVEKFLSDFAKRLAGQFLQTGLDRLFGAIFGGGGAALVSGPSLPAVRPMPRPSFAGGGFTGWAPRTGGLDGQGGFMAMLHPQETVIDHARGGRGGREVTVNVVARSDPGVILEIARTEAVQVTRAGLEAYDRQMAPAMVARVTSDPSRRG